MCLLSCLESSGASDQSMCNTLVSVLFCAIRKMTHFWASFIPKMPKPSGNVVDIIPYICKQHVWTNLTCRLSVSWRSALSLSVDRFDSPADIQSCHFIHFCTKLDFGSSLAITEHKGWEELGGIPCFFLDNPGPFLEFKIRTYSQLLWTCLFHDRVLAISFFGEH